MGAVILGDVLKRGLEQSVQTVIGSLGCTGEPSYFHSVSSELVSQQCQCSECYGRI